MGNAKLQISCLQITHDHHLQYELNMGRILEGLKLSDFGPHCPAGDRQSGFE